jgi:O-antigen/teichoic acid export membrane protein
MTRILTPNDYGFINVFNVKVTILVVLGSLGIRNIIVRSIARDRAISKSFFKASSFIRFLTTLIVLIIYYIYRLFFQDNFSSFDLYLLIASFIFSILWDMVETIAFGLERMEITAFLNFFATLFFVLCLYILPKTFWNIHRILLFNVIIQMIKSFVYYVLLRYNEFVGGHESLTQISIISKKLVHDSMPYYLLAVFSMLSSQMPILFLEARSSSAEVAFYNLGFKILSPMQMALSMALVALFPNISRVFLEDKARFQRIVRKAIISIIVLGIITAFTISFFRKEVILLLYDQRYVTAAAVIAFQCWYTIWFAIFCLQGTVIGAADRQKALPVLSFIYALISVPILWIGASFGAVGLSMSYIIASFFNMTYNWWYFNKILPQKFNLGFTALIFFILIFAMGISFTIPENLNLILKLALFLGLGLLVLLGLANRTLRQFCVKYILADTNTPMK